MPNDSSKKDHSKNESSDAAENIRQESSSQNNRLRILLAQIRESILPLTYRPGVHTRNHLLGAGFTYTGNGDTARCEDCGFEVSGWTADMDPFNIHSMQRPDCPFVRSNTPSSSLITVVRNTPVSNEQENTPEHQSIESVDSDSSLNSFTESDLLQQVRRRTFSHWPHRTMPSSAQMIEAGFFNCNIEDRVICIYCNLICQQWTSYVDDPCEVHRTLSPNCIYARASLARRGPLFIINNNQRLMTVTADRLSFGSNHINSVQISHHVRPVAQNNNCGTIQNDLSSSTSSSRELPSVDDNIQANYFNTDEKTVVTCFCCNGSLRNLGSNENPMIDHARRFPDCPYVQQLYGTEIYRQIEESRRAKHAGTKDTGQLLISDQNALNRLVAARLDLPISQRLLDKNFKLSIIKRCWEDQLRLKQDDFVSECDLYIACLILQKQIEHINGKKENIVIPSERMRQFREHATKEEAEVLEQRRAAREANSRDTLNDNILWMTTSKQTTSTTPNEEQPANETPSKPCVLCLEEEARLACIPCGHLATCVPCGHSLRSCPICRRAIEAFVRIYV